MNVPSIEVKPKRKTKVLLASIGLLLILVLAYFFYNKNDSSAIVEEIDKSIAVLPFTDMSQGGDQQYFADGVMEDILTQLQRMGELDVTSRTSVEQFRETTKSAPEIGVELGVNYLLDGSVRKAGNQIMITAQLIRTNDDTHLWADNFTSEYTTDRLFDIQRTIAENIVGELKLKISPDKVQEITQAQTNSKEAYEHYIRGRLLYSQHNKKSMEKSIVEFQQAIATDPDYGAAYGGIANSFIQTVFYGYSLNWSDSAEVYAKKGIQLDENCAVCYKALGLLYQNTKSSKEGLKQYEKALQINPNYGVALGNSARHYAFIGDYESSIQTIQKGWKVRPNSIAYNLGGLYSLMDEFKTALPYWKANFKIDDGFWDRVYLLDELIRNKSIDGFKEISTEVDVYGISFDIAVAWIEDDYNKIIQFYKEYQKQDRTIASRRLPIMALISYYRLERRDEALELASDAVNAIGQNPERPRNRAWWVYYYVLQEKNEEALGQLEKAIEDGWLQSISDNIIFESLYDHPRFQELVEKQKKKREEVMALVATYNFPEPEDL